MGKTISIPTDLFPDGECPEFPGRTALWRYDSTQSSIKTRVTIKKNLFSFLLEGEKVVHRPGDPIRVAAGQFLLIAGSNCLMTEKLSTQGRYRSLLFFFDDGLLTDFDTDAFIGNFIRSLELLVEQAPASQGALQQLKLEEVLLYLADRYPQRLHTLRRLLPGDSSDEQLMAAVTGNLNHAITVEELAFLCNMSLSTFNRRFGRLYGTTPNKWLLQKRMEQAAVLLNEREKPSEIYFKLGYENHSSFTQSFKQVYGVTPREYQQRMRVAGSVG
jgi:AraC-like DNA-binding protein